MLKSMLFEIIRVNIQNKTILLLNFIKCTLKGKKWIIYIPCFQELAKHVPPFTNQQTILAVY